MAKKVRQLRDVRCRFRFSFCSTPEAAMTNIPKKTMNAVSFVVENKLRTKQRHLEKTGCGSNQDLQDSFGEFVEMSHFIWQALIGYEM